MSRLMPASTPQNASQIKDVHDRTSSWGQVAHSESWYYKIGLEVFPRLETVIEEMKLARCGEHPGGANPAEILDPYLTYVNSIRVYIVQGST
jgi:hypothetical protein